MLIEVQMTLVIDRVAAKTPPGMRQTVSEKEKEEEGMGFPFQAPPWARELNVV